jgi:hypothetical protein
MAYLGARETIPAGKKSGPSNNHANLFIFCYVRNLLEYLIAMRGKIVFTTVYGCN